MASPDSRAGHRRTILVVALLLCALAAWLLWSGQPDEQEVSGTVTRTSQPEQPEAEPVLEGRVRPSVPPLQPPAAPTPPLVVAPGRPHAYSIEGFVRDLATKQILPDAQVAGWGLSLDTQTGRAERHEIEASSRVDGGFRLDVTGAPIPVVTEFGLRDTAWHVLAWEREGGGDALGMDTAPGAQNRVTLWARRAFHLRGVVQDAQGHPLPDAYINFITASLHGATATFGNTLVKVGRDGRFDIGPFAQDPALGLPSPGVLGTSPSFRQIFFRNDGMSTVVLEPLSVSVDDRDRLVITLQRAITLAGILIDERGHPLADVPVTVEYGSRSELRRGVRTDGEGYWSIADLTPGSAVLQARAFAHDAKARRELVLTQEDLAVRLVAEPIRLSRPPATIQILGLSLADVDDELRRAYEIPASVHVLILDPGPEPERLGIGRLAKGHGLLMVGEHPIGSLRDAVGRLLDPSSSGQETMPSSPRRVVYTFWSEAGLGRETRHLNLTAKQLEELTALRERLWR